MEHVMVTTLLSAFLVLGVLGAVLAVITAYGRGIAMKENVGTFESGDGSHLSGCGSCGFGGCGMPKAVDAEEDERAGSICGDDMDNPLRRL